ncbi:vWA domain-containing protein [Campylobacter gastrosuis]|uniref:VWA domain-containing protein n=1 Tax=Campylobacter gastrosuis TaxID=2974576 RepID=A0ABT7HQL7_9BACT|nr:VWA domain-containing protein [Campylobacter gastrosuis]MDL0088684.1 VWA domain-containing protein [Campylobacter gastrosuis]
MKQELISLKDLIDNPTPRVPVCLCLDTSGSMIGDPIMELNEGVKLFYEAIKEDEIALFSADIAIVTFGSNGIRVIRDFAGLSTDDSLPILDANGGTPMAEAVSLALEILDKRKNEYQNKGVDYYQPWLVLMTDGQPDSLQNLEEPIAKINELINNKKLTIFPIGIGDNVDMNILAKFSPKRPPLKLQGLKFKEFFAWLSQSVSRTSQSTPGESVKLDIDGIKSWGEL